jgi:DNA-binding PadR family transcriptional regulator
LTNDSLFVKDQTELTKGNLSSHLAKLESAGYINVEKTFVDKIPRTLYRLTPQGKAALGSYREHMSGVLKNLER